MQRGATDVEIFGQLMNFELTFRTACDMLPTLDYIVGMSYYSLAPAVVIRITHYCQG